MQNYLKIENSENPFPIFVENGMYGPIREKITRLYFPKNKEDEKIISEFQKLH